MIVGYSSILFPHPRHPFVTHGTKCLEEGRWTQDLNGLALALIISDL